MADFALWATACETALWPAGTFARAYDANRKAAVEGIIEMDPVAVCVRKLMAGRSSWAGTASDLLRAATDLAGDNISKRSADWPKNPAALAGRLRRAQTFLRMLGIEIAFSREGRAGTRTIKISSSVENRATTVSAVSTVSAVCHNISARYAKEPQRFAAFAQRVSDADDTDAQPGKQACRAHRKSSSQRRLRKSRTLCLCPSMA
jgi:hypothetical protein